MALLMAEQLKKSFGTEVLFQDVSLSIQPKDRIGLVGDNGSGKTTLLKVLMEQSFYEAGTISLDDHTTIGYMEQHVCRDQQISAFAEVLTAFQRLLQIEEQLEYLELQLRNPARLSEAALHELVEQQARLHDDYLREGGLTYRSRTRSVMQGLGFDEDKMALPVMSLSGGQKAKLQLAKLLLSNANLLFLDEPTNHLDIEAVEWLESFLLDYDGAFVVISHDRYFLDRTVTRIIEVLDGKAEFYSGNYSFYAVEKERRYLEKMRQYEKEQAKIRQLEAAADKLHLWAFMGNDALHKRAFSMEKRIERMRTTDKPTREKKMTAQFRSSEFLGDEVLTLKGVGKSFGERTLFSGVDLKVAGGERIALIGDNGTGKSTLIKMIMGEEYPDEGRIKLGPSTKIAYLPQIIHFDVPQRNLVDTMLYSKRDITPQKARDRLAAFHFRGEDVFKSVSVLSGGEQSRLRLCMLMDDEVNFLILDEPTNHLDIASREWIEEAVEAFDGTLLFVSHDRYFINRFATRVWELAGGVITDYPMGFAQYRQAKEEERAAAAAAVQVQSAAPKKNGSRGNRAQQAAKKQLTICETAIARLEADSARLEAEMAENACDAEKLNALYQEQQDVQKRLEQEMERWEELSLQAEEQEDR